MVKNHLKRIFTPKTWPVLRKENKFITRPNPGGHSFEHSLPLVVVFKDLLGIASTTREVKFILNNEEVLINGRRKRRPEDTFGLMDVLSFPKIKESYRLILTSKNILKTIPVSGSDAETIPSKIVKKTYLKGGKVQLSFHNGRNLILDEKEAKKYALGDTLVLSFKNEIKKHLPLKEGAVVYFIRGSHIGRLGTIKSHENTIVKVVGKDESGAEEEFETKRDYAFVVGEAGKVSVKIE